MTTSSITIAYTSALVSSAATLTLVYDVELARAGLLAAVGVLVLFSAIAGLVGALRWSRPLRAEWHRRRARVLADRQSTLCSLWPWALAVWLVFALAEWGHILRAEAIGS